jgi:hypothetical protein
MTPAPPTIPCSALAFAALVARVAACMDDSGTLREAPFAPVAGRCRLCGHALPYAYSLTECLALPTAEKPDGEYARREFAADSKEAAAFEKMNVPGLRLGPGLALLWPKAQNDRYAERMRFEPKPDPEAHDVRCTQTMSGFPTIVAAANLSCEAANADVFAAASRIRRDKAAVAKRAGQTRELAQELALKASARRAAAALAHSESKLSVVPTAEPVPPIAPQPGEPAELF